MYAPGALRESCLPARKVTPVRVPAAAIQSASSSRLIISVVISVVMSVSALRAHLAGAESSFLRPHPDVLGRVRRSGAAGMHQYFMTMSYAS